MANYLGGVSDWLAAACAETLADLADKPINGSHGQTAAPTKV
jgi:hypothetical protein